jgi:hypothetical protein
VLNLSFAALLAQREYAVLLLPHSDFFFVCPCPPTRHRDGKTNQFFFEAVWYRVRTIVGHIFSAARWLFLRGMRFLAYSYRRFLIVCVFSVLLLFCMWIMVLPLTVVVVDICAKHVKYVVSNLIVTRRKYCFEMHCIVVVVVIIIIVLCRVGGGM